MMCTSRSWPRRTPEVALLHEQSVELVGRATIDWAVTALTEGYDTAALRMLAGLDLLGAPSGIEIRSLFEKALAELEIELPDLETTARLYLKDVASAIVAGEIEPRVGANLVHRRVITALEHPRDLMAWCYVWEGNSADCSRPLEDHEVDEEIRRLAAEFVGGAT